MKIKNNIICLLIIIILVLSSCVKKDDSNKVVVRYSAPGFMLYNKIREKIGKEFEKEYPNVKTVYEPISGQGFFEKIQTQIAGGTEPDVFFMRDFELPIFVDKGAIMELNTHIKSDKDFDLADYHKILIDSYTVRKKIYGLPGSFTSGVIFYNKDILDKAGMKPFDDLSWAKLLKVGQELTSKNSQGTVQQFGIILEYYDWITFILQNNGKVFSSNKKKCVLYSKNAVDAIKYLKTLFKGYHITPNSIDLEQSEAYRLFMNSRGAMFTGGRWYTTMFNEVKSFKWGIMPFFFNKKRSVRLDSHSWVISKNCKNSEIAWKFLKFLTSKDSNWKMVEVGDSVPVHKSNVDKFIKLNPENKVFIDSLKYAYTVDKIMSPYISWREMQNVFREEFDRFKIGDQSAVNTLKAIEKRINRTINRNL